MPFRRTPLVLASVAFAVAVPAAPAHAAYFPGEQVDAGAEVLSVGDVDVARDGSGGVAYLKREDGAPHVFVSRLVNGVWQTPERVDPGLTAAAEKPTLAVADNGRLLVAYLSGGHLFAAVRPAGASGFTAPQLLSAAAGEPVADMSINGAAYIAFTQPGASAADLRVARLERDGQQLSVLSDTLDIDPARDAGTGTGRPRLSTSADGTALVVWGEAGHVYGRRLFEQRVSTAPQQLSVEQYDGRAAGAADLADVDMEDDSSYAWAAFRQRLDDGRAHTFVRRFRGSQFEEPRIADGFGIPSADDATGVHVDITGRGEGVVSTSSAANGTYVALIHDDQPFPATAVASSALAPAAVGGIAENNDAFVAYRSGGSPSDAAVHLRPFDIDPAKRTVPGPGPEAVVSNRDLGPVDLGAGLDIGVNRAGDAVAVFVQGSGPGRTLASGGFDRPPGSFRTYTATKFRSLSKTPLAWGAAFDLWGPITYRVEVDGRAVAETTETKLTSPPSIPDGRHTWRVVATDGRGQRAVTPSRPLRVDGTPPTVSFRVSGMRRAGRTITVRPRAGDPDGSGVKFLRIDFGDGSRIQTRTPTAVKHVYRRKGTFRIRVSATDKAGNAIATSRRVKIAKK